MAALAITSLSHIHCGNYGLAKEQLDELCALADEKGAVFWKVGAMLLLGCVSALNGKAADAVDTVEVGIQAWRSTGASLWMPMYLAHLIGAYADLGRFDEAWRCFGEATSLMQQTKERWCEAEIYRIAGRVAIHSPGSDVDKPETFFRHALDVAQAQQTKSYELRAATSLAGFWRDQGRCDEAHRLLAPIYCWYTEGFDTNDLRRAKTLLDTLG